MNLSNYPQSQKKLQTRKEGDTIALFLVWLETKGYAICAPTAGMMDMPYHLPLHKPINEWLADYFEIDLDKLEQERIEILNMLAEGKE